MTVIKFDDIITTEFSDKLDIGIFHFKAEMMGSSGESISGFGSALDQKLAMKKALFELFERAVVRDYQRKGLSRSSNGFAAHINLDLASQSAGNEIIERDCFLSRWLQMESPYWIPKNDPILLKNDLYKRFFDSAVLSGFEFRVGILLESNSHVVLTGLIMPNQHGRFGFALTSACGTSFQETLESILLTISRYCTILFNRSQQGTPLYQDFHVFRKAQDHFEYYLHPNHAQKVKWFLSQGKPWKNTPLEGKIEIFEAERNFDFPMKCSIAVARSCEAQDYFLGETEPSILCQRLRLNLNRPNFNWQVHPLP